MFIEERTTRAICPSNRLRHPPGMNAPCLSALARTGLSCASACAWLQAGAYLPRSSRAGPRRPKRAGRPGCSRARRGRNSMSARVRRRAGPSGRGVRRWPRLCRSWSSCRRSYPCRCWQAGRHVVRIGRIGAVVDLPVFFSGAACSVLPCRKRSIAGARLAGCCYPSRRDTHVRNSRPMSHVDGLTRCVFAQAGAGARPPEERPR